MDKDLSPEELAWLQKLRYGRTRQADTARTLSARLITMGLAIELAEGGLQLTDLGRARLPRR